METCRRPKINPGGYAWTQVMLEIRDRLWAVVTVALLPPSQLDVLF